MAEQTPKRRPAGRRRLDSGSVVHLQEDSSGLLSREALTQTEEVPIPPPQAEAAASSATGEDRLVRMLLGLAVAIAAGTTVYVYLQRLIVAEPLVEPPKAAAQAPKPAVASPPSVATRDPDAIDGVRVKARMSSGVYDEGVAGDPPPAPPMDQPPTM